MQTLLDQIQIGALNSNYNKIYLMNI
jgi:hypothetical protein